MHSPLHTQSTTVKPDLCSRHGQDQQRGGHRRRAPEVCQGAQRQHQGWRQRTQQRERDCLQRDGEDVVSPADHVAGIAVRVHLRPLRGVSVEEMYPLNQTEGLCPLDSVSKVQNSQNVTWKQIPAWQCILSF